ncbi:MAG TPA: acyl-CoA reductase [Verrucomicrobiae bacterium]|nr:acyl-CoA reductase [Verrucomicrobiae bacterium]
MNLPNYFFADLPPEAPLTPRMISEACDTLRRNREKFLAPRSTQEMVEILCEVAAHWLAPENKFRKFALERGPAETGFSKPVLERGLDDFFRQFTPENFQALLEQEFGHPQRLEKFVSEENSNRNSIAIAPELLAHVCAGNIPNPTLTSIAFGLLLRSAQLVKCASGASFLPRLFAHSIYELNPKFGACLEVAEWRGGNLELERALFANADCVTATGSDEALEKIRAQLPLNKRFTGYGHRVSFAFVTKEIFGDEDVLKLVSRAADDVMAWDQNGCLSPHVIYAGDGGAVEPERFAGLLAAELMNRETISPRGKISTEESAAIASRRAIYETLAVHRPDAKIWASKDSTAWTVVFEHEPRFQFSPLNRFIYVKPVANFAAMLQGADEIRGKVSTVGIAATEAKLNELAPKLARWGATRICPLGQMQNPPLTWRHDGRSPLGDLVTWTDVEARGIGL